MPLISHESPLCLLEESLKYNDYQYILPYFWFRYPEYKEFMLKHAKNAILDNGLFEGETYTIQEQINMINTIKPKIYIVQDEWNDNIQTLKNAKYWMGLQKGGAIDKNVKLMVVMQGKTFMDIEILYRLCVDLGYTHFAINHSSSSYSNHYYNNYVDHKEEDNIDFSYFCRPDLIKHLIDRNVIKKYHYIHLLGATNINEFKEYNREPFDGIINSIDTSSPIIKGIEEGLYTEENTKTKSKNKLEKYFEEEFDSHTKDCIFSNIKIFKNLINYGK